MISTDHGRVELTAISDDGETFVVDGDDLHTAAWELAEQVGLDLWRLEDA